MTRSFPALSRTACALTIVAALSGCASRQDVSALGERMLFLEREVLAARTEAAADREALHALDLRVEYLEREADPRGTIPPRRSPSPSARPSAGGSPGGGSGDAVPASPASPAAAPDRRTPPTSPDSPPREPDSRQTPGAASPESAASPAAKPGSLPSPAGSQTVSLAGASESVPPAPLPDVRESTPATPTPPATPAAAPARSEQNAYDAALQLYRTGRFPEAEAAFQAFLEVYPDSRLTPNALYWKGETFYSRGQHTEAIFAFKDVQTRFPRHPKTPDSLLKTAMAYQRLGDAANASLHLAALYEDWPKSEAAQRARRMGLKP